MRRVHSLRLCAYAAVRPTLMLRVQSADRRHHLYAVRFASSALPELPKSAHRARRNRDPSETQGLPVSTMHGAIHRAIPSCYPTPRWIITSRSASDVFPCLHGDYSHAPAGGQPIEAGTIRSNTSRYLRDKARCVANRMRHRGRSGVSIALVSHVNGVCLW